MREDGRLNLSVLPKVWEPQGAAKDEAWREWASAFG